MAVRTEQFLDDLNAAYSIAPQYKPADHYPILKLPTAERFATRRRKAIYALIEDKEYPDATPRAFLSEWTSYLCIAGPLDEYGYTVEMAAQGLEAGDEKRKGIDLVITERNDGPTIPLLGINVKLRTLDREKSTETQRFDPKICAPMITLSLGDWKPETREQEPVAIREWIDSHALPKITTTGKLPQFYQLRQFVFGCVSDALESYRWKVESHVGGFYDTTGDENDKYLLPTNPNDFDTFYEKLVGAHELFSDLVKKV